VEALGPGNDQLSDAPRRVGRTTMRRGLTVAALAALLAVIPGVVEGGRNPVPTQRHTVPAIRISATGASAGGHAPALGPASRAAIATSRAGGHAAAGIDNRARTTATHAAQRSDASSAPAQTSHPVSSTGAQGGHQAAFVLEFSPSRLRPTQQDVRPAARGGTSGANTSDPAAPAGNAASHSGRILLPRTWATSDQRATDHRASATPPVITITIGRRAKSNAPGGKVDGAGFGPLGGTVDVTIRSPDASPPVAPAVGPLVGPVTDVAIDLSGLFATQFDGSLFATANCNMAAGAMLFEVQTGLNVTGGQMRAWSGATSQGTSLEDLARAFASQGQPLPIQRYLSWNDFQRQVASGRSAVVQGWYGYLPRHYVLQPGFVDGHSVFVLGYSAHVFGGRGGFYVMDPLGRAGYSGAWWPSGVLRAYGWSGKPGHAGEGNKLSYLGFVALQAHRSTKKPMSSGGRPAFQNYWQTTKDALEAALKVIIMSGHGTNVPAIRGVVLFIKDPKLNMSAASAQKSHAMRWPVAGTATILRGFSARHPDLALAPGPHASVLAAAAGRVIFESWRNGSGTQTVWIEHGPDLFTVYSGLGHVDVKPSQWVAKGDRLGSLGRSPGVLLFSISVGALPTSTRGHVDPTRFLSPS
jgi:hypothetical protein